MRAINDILKYSKPLTLLYVEDNDNLRIRNEEIFLEYFREVVCVSGAIEALSLYKHRKERTGHTFDIIITDIEMPRINGIELCRRLLALNPDQKLIALSAHNEPRYLFELINMGISSFLLKPITALALSEALYTTSKSIYDERILRFRTHQVDSLNHKLKAKVDELNIAITQAHEESRRKDLFLARLTREIGIPLSEIIDSLGQLRQTPLDEAQSRHTHRIRQSAQRAAKILAVLGEISAIDAGETVLESVEFNLNDILARLAERIAPAALEKNIDLAFDVAKEVPIRFISDSGRLEQILLQLLNNAITFTSSGGVRLKIDIEKGTGSTRIVEFIVVDTGIGMSSAQCATVFDPFFEPSLRTAKPFKNAGFSLILSKKLVHRMGGEISVRSSLGKGSTFTVRIPLYLSQPQERRLYRLPHASMMGKNVLIIDPHPWFTDSLVQKLRYFHCDVDIHPDCTSCALSHCHYDLIMVDPTRLEELQTLLPPNLPGVKLVVLGNSAREGMAASIDATLSKPCTQQMLFELFLALYGEKYDTPFQTNRPGGGSVLQDLRGSRIVLAEENEADRQRFLGMLENTGIEVTVVSNGLEVLKLLEQREADLVLMNHRMPIMGGVQAALTIRSRPLLDPLPLIVLTDETFRGDADTFAASGIQGSLKKPLKPGELYALLSRFITPRKPLRSDALLNA